MAKTKKKKGKKVKAPEVKAPVVLESYTEAEKKYMVALGNASDKAEELLTLLTPVKRLEMRVRAGNNADKQGITIKAELTRAFNWKEEEAQARYKTFLAQISIAKDAVTPAMLKKLGMEKRDTSPKNKGYTDKSLEAAGEKLKRSKPEIVLAALQHDVSVLVDKAAKLDNKEVERIEFVIHQLVSIARLHGVIFSVNKVVNNKTATVNHKAVTVN